MILVSPEQIATVMTLPVIPHSIVERDELLATDLPKTALRESLERACGSTKQRQRLLYRIVPEATFKRRRDLTPEESAKTEGLARLRHRAVRPELRGRRPRLSERAPRHAPRAYIARGVPLRNWCPARRGVALALALRHRSRITRARAHLSSYRRSPPSHLGWHRHRGPRWALEQCRKAVDRRLGRVRLRHARGGGAGRLQRAHRDAAVDVPESVAIERRATEALPAGWDLEDGAAARIFGARWLEEGRTALLIVPSVVARIEWNVLINPRHPDATQL